MLTTSPTSCTSGAFQVAAMPIACGNTVAIAGRGDAVQALVPPIVLAHAQAVDGRRVIHQLRDLFLERHARNEVGGARLGAQADVAVGRRRRIVLGEGPRAEAGAGEQGDGHQGQASDGVPVRAGCAKPIRGEAARLGTLLRFRQCVGHERPPMHARAFNASKSALRIQLASAGRAAGPVPSRLLFVCVMASKSD